MSEEYLPGIGLDVGTSFLQVARMKPDETVEFRSERDAFFVMVPQGKANARMIEQMLKQKGAFSLKEEGKFYIVGSHAIELANVRMQPVERPLKKGVLSDSETNTFGMLSKLIESILGKATTQGELCVYTYPADPIDEDFDIVYHKNRMSEILSGLGYKPMPLLESVALGYSELFNDVDNMTGVVISCGAGMHNLTMMHMGQDLFSFSIAQGGDYIDRHVAKQMQISETIVQAEKESGIDLLNPQDKLQKAISIYYDALINYVVDALEKKFAGLDQVPRFGTKVPVVIAGGTCLPNGYLEKVSLALLSKDFPFEIGDIRRATHPDALRSVANGCLVYARFELEE